MRTKNHYKVRECSLAPKVELMFHNQEQCLRQWISLSIIYNLRGNGVLRGGK